MKAKQNTKVVDYFRKKGKMLTALLMGMLVISLSFWGSYGISQAAEVEYTDEDQAELQQAIIKADLTISNARELNEFAHKVNDGNSYEGKVIKLTNDIAFDGITINNFTPIGTIDNPFMGTFDGCGHTISGIDVISEDAGLFGYVGFGAVRTVIKNVTIDNCSFWGIYYVAGIVANVLPDVTISNCSVMNSEIKVVSSANSHAGNIVGNVCGRTTIKNCYANSSVEGGSSYESYAGGIVGYINYGDTDIKNSCNTGRVTGYNVGGICAFVGYDDSVCDVNSEFQNCYNTGKVERTGSDFNEDDRYEGGIVGFGGTNLIVANCYSSKESSSHNFGEMQGIEKNNKQYSSDYMKSVQFLNQLNSNRGSNSDWFRWEIRSDSAFPLPVKITSMARCNITMATGDYTYTNTAYKPAVTITNGSYKLVNDVDYTISYSNNVNAGTTYVYISGINSYTGDIKLPFTINKANTTFSGKKKISKIYTDKVFALNVKLSSGNGKLSYKSSDKKVATVSQNGKVSVKGIGEARITITAAETKNYKSAEYEVTITVKPKKQKVTLKIKKNKIVATWKKDSKASGYQIQCATNKKFTKNCRTIDVTKKKTTKHTFKKIKKKIKYYVRVRSYKKVKKNGKTTIIYGSWSKIKVISSKK